MVVQMLHKMSLDIQQASKEDANCAVKSIERWRICYCLIGKLVDQLNRCFGIILLMLIAFYFVWCVGGSFFAFVTVRDKKVEDAGIVLFFIIQLVSLPILITVLSLPHQIKRKVLHQLLLNELRNIAQFLFPFRLKV